MIERHDRKSVLVLPCRIGDYVYRVGCTRIRGIPCPSGFSGDKIGTLFVERFNLSKLDPETGELLPYYFTDMDEAMDYINQLPDERAAKIKKLKEEVRDANNSEYRFKKE